MVARTSSPSLWESLKRTEAATLGLNFAKTDEQGGSASDGVACLIAKQRVDVAEN